MLSGIIFINRNGLRWCDAPKEYGPPKTLYNRWKRWSDNPRLIRLDFLRAGSVSPCGRHDGLLALGVEQRPAPEARF